MRKLDIKNFTLESLERTVHELGEPRYRAGQIFLWLYRKGVADFGDIKNIPAPLREKLSQKYYISALELSAREKAVDKTEKFLFRLEDGYSIETVLIRAKHGATLCVSTQVGCRFTCSFCASGRMGFARNLTASEILNQALYVIHNLKINLTNFVFMGMGEPLDNYKNVTEALMIMTNPNGLNVSAGRITISTAGIIPGIKKLENLPLKVNLSVSLHAANNRLRNKLVPINKLYPLDGLVKACVDYVNKTGRPLTLEYVLIKNVNDSLKDAEELASLARRLKAKVNLIPANPAQDSACKSPDAKTINLFMKILACKGVMPTLRKSKGRDIRAACGMLAGGKSK